MKRTNILFAIADDASHFGAYGHTFVKTPNFDWVAENGLLFNNAFTTNPKCAPSRASILTGRHTWQLEEACNHLVCTFPEKFDCFSDILMQNGYFVGYTGKGWAPGFWKETRKYNPAGPEYNDERLKRPHNTNVSDIDYVANFQVFLSEKPSDEPFCFWYGGKEPHRHYVPGEGIRNGKSLDDIDNVPAYWPDDEIVRSDMLDYAFEIEWFDTQLGKIIQHIRATGELENTIIIVTSDNGCPFPRIKGQMYEQDFRLPLAICWLDQIKAGRTADDLISFTDFAPTFLEIAGIDIHPQMSGKSFLDVLLSDISGQIDETRNVVYMGRECHDCGREDDVGYPVRCIRTTHYLYVHNFESDRWPAGNPETHFTNCDGSPTKDNIIRLNEHGESIYFDLAFGKRPKEELYNINNDPECINNLAEDAQFSGIKEELRIDLFKYLKDSGDPRIFGNGSVFDEYVVEKFASSESSWKAYIEGRWKIPGFMDWKAYESDDV